MDHRRGDLNQTSNSNLKKATRGRVAFLFAGLWLFHQQHLPGALDGPVQPPLIMGGKPRIFAWKNPALIRHKLPKKVDILEIEGIRREVDLWLWPWSADLHRRTTRSTVAAFIRFVGTSLARHGVI